MAYLRVAVKQICIDCGGDNHDAEALCCSKNSKYHIMPTIFKCEPEDNEGDGKNSSCGISDKKASFRVNMAIMATSIGSTDGIMEPVACKPPQEAADDPKEVEIP